MESTAGVLRIKREGYQAELNEVRIELKQVLGNI